jgi:NAD(P)-dependent dehydrogenase (short-subunit alcohol dehydrogenase family)
MQRVADKVAVAGARAEVQVLDVTDEASVVAGFAAVAETHGGVDVLVNNAAIEHEAPAVETAVADFDRVLRTNLTGSFLCARSFAALPARGPGRSIVNVSSLIAETGVRGQVAYGASKAGVLSMTRTLALELARDGIRVNALAPGYFATDMPAAVLSDEGLRDRLVRRIPLRRVGEPEEIGPPVVFLASPASRYMTGATLYFDGGFTA